MPKPLPTVFSIAAIAFSTALPAQATTLTHPLDPAGSTTSVDTTQPSLAMTALVQTSGSFAQALGQIKFFAGNFVPRGFMEAAGQSLDIASNTALFSLFGTTYGGDGRTYFNLPDLRERAVIGTGTTNAGRTYTLGERVGTQTVGVSAANLPAHDHQTDDGTSSTTGDGQAYNNMQPALALDIEVVTQGIYPDGPALPDETLGFLQIDAAVDNSFGDATKRSANGDLLPIASNDALFSLYGATYGGDGRTTFGVPNTAGRVVTGEGTGPGLTQRNLGSTRGTEMATLTEAEMETHVHGDPDAGVDTQPTGSGARDSNLQPEITLNWLIGLEGIFPPRGPDSVSSTGNVYDGPFLGEMALFGGNFAPRGWAMAQGQLLSINQYTALFSILGTQYGGDGRTTFALPDLRGRVAVGAGEGPLQGVAMGVGDTYGTETVSILAAHSHTVERVAPVPLPASLPLLLAGMGIFGLYRRRT